MDKQEPQQSRSSSSSPDEGLQWDANDGEPMDDLQNKGDGARREVRPLASSYAAPLVGEINGLLIPGWYFPSLILSGLSVQHQHQGADSDVQVLSVASLFFLWQT